VGLAQSPSKRISRLEPIRENWLDSLCQQAGIEPSLPRVAVAVCRRFALQSARSEDNNLAATMIPPASTQCAVQEIGRQRGIRPSELKSLTGLRGFAACWVVLLHFYSDWLVLWPGLKNLELFAQRGYLGVDIFFVLSGFILSYVYLRDPAPLTMSAYKEFLAMRWARIYPAHFTILVILIVVLILSRAVGFPWVGSYSLKSLIAQLTLTVWGPLGALGWNVPAWSVSAEWFAYVFIFPVCWWLTRRTRNPSHFLLLSLFSLILWDVIWQLALTSAGASRACFEFFAGAMAFGASWREPRVEAFCRRILAPLTFSWLLLLAACGLPFVPQVIVLTLPIFLIGLAAEGSPVGRVAATPLLVWAGRISYSVYLSHAVIQTFLHVLCPVQLLASQPAALRIGFFCAQMLLLVSGASALYYFVECPARSYLRGLFQSNLSSPGNAPAPRAAPLPEANPLAAN
jgi:peptidoglycan/LPS O-acetylase OafA/YrhL